MSAVFTAYVALQLGVCVSATALFLLSRAWPSLDARNLLGLHYAAAVLVVAVALLAPWLSLDWVAASATLQTGVAGHAMEDFAAIHPATSYLASIARLHGLQGLPTASLWLAAAVGGCVTWRWLRDAWRLRRLRQRAQLLRSHGRVRIWISDGAHSPFSFRGPRCAHVFIPQFMVARHDWYRMAIAHELQHHRQGDTAWLHAFTVLQVLAGSNPLVWLWSAAVARQQEFACDAALLDRTRWPAADYAQGLLDVARAAAPHRGAAWAPSLTGKRHNLKRRIEHMMERKRTPPGTPVRIALYAGLLAALGFTGAAAGSLAAGADVQAVQPGTRAAGALPIRGGVVAASFEIPEEGASRRAHAGVDIAAPVGTPVHAWQDGVVVLAGQRKGCGLAVMLQHWQGTRSLYCNLANLRVAPGESVGRDQSLGEIADLGANRKPHLHFEIEIDGRNVDPAGQVDLLAPK